MRFGISTKITLLGVLIVLITASTVGITVFKDSNGLLVEHELSYAFKTNDVLGTFSGNHIFPGKDEIAGNDIGIGIPHMEMDKAMNNAFQGMKALLVDDDKRNTFALSMILDQAGFETILAEDGQQALIALENNPDVDIVLMDIMMPVMDGYEAIERIRSQPRHEYLPILAVTAKAMKEDRDKCLKIGATDYLPKPIEARRLFSMMASCLKLVKWKNLKR